jgi:hypothetical protein
MSLCNGQVGYVEILGSMVMTSPAMICIMHGMKAYKYGSSRRSTVHAVACSSNSVKTIITTKTPWRQGPAASLVQPLLYRLVRSAAVEVGFRQRRAPGPGQDHQPNPLLYDAGYDGLLMVAFSITGTVFR